MDRRTEPDDDGRVTVRVPLPPAALLVALLLHVVVFFVVRSLPDPTPPPKRIQITINAQSPKPPPPVTAGPTRPPPAKKRTPAPLPPTSPVLPVLPPSQSPPENRAQLPVVEQSPDPAPPPPSSFEQRMRDLASTAPRRPKQPTGELMPSYAAVERVAAADPRLHDEETEQRMMADYGPFFRRGLEALRGHWHPDEVLRATERDPSKRCGYEKRTTYAVAVLDKSGHVVDVDLKTPSGCPQLDEEAIAAFVRTAHFPNPPEGIFVAPDGTPTLTARYPVRFIVSFERGGFRLDWR